MTIFTEKQLLEVCKAKNTQINISIASAILSMYMQAKNFFQEDMIDCMQDFLSNGILNFAKYKLQF